MANQIRVPAGRLRAARERHLHAARPLSRRRCPARASAAFGGSFAKFGNGLLHITTRQEFQIHRVPLDSIIPALRSLAKAGLSTKGGGGNTVRNITGLRGFRRLPRRGL
jgi:sulfite reductase beta subunit-like hemoprotein